MTQEYKIHAPGIWIKGNGSFRHYMVHGNAVSVLVQDMDGDEYLEPFHTIGELPMNSEAKLINDLREQGKL